MQIEKTKLPDVCLLQPQRFTDTRGFFAETYNAKNLAKSNIHTKFVQDNHSLSREVGTLRGLHFQAPPSAQAKLVRCGRGALFDVAVDIRRGSPSYGAWVGYELTEENGHQLLIPEGFLHGFLTLRPDTEIVYKCSDFYAPECDGAVRWDDPDLAIDWPLDGAAPVLSAKDAAAPTLAEFETPFIYEGAGHAVPS